MDNYGERVCLWCGKKFEAEYASQLCCSAECRRARRLEQTKKSAKRVSDLARRVDALEARVKNLEEKDGLRKETGDGKEISSLSEEGKETGRPEKEADKKEMTGDEAEKPLPDSEELPYFCSRTKVRSLKPPRCGENDICYEPKRCTRVPPNYKGLTAPHPVTGKRQVIKENV